MKNILNYLSKKSVIHLFIFINLFFSSAFAPPSEQNIISMDTQDEIKEWHFHVYFLWSNPAQVEAANQLRANLLNQVQNGNFLAVFAGINKTIIPELSNEDAIPSFNTRPIGPHVSGSFEVWVPFEYLAPVMSWMILNRGELSIFLHPLTRFEMEDHSSRSMWLGTTFPLDFSPLSHDLKQVPKQYPELKLGYSSTSASNI